MKRVVLAAVMIALFAGAVYGYAAHRVLGLYAEEYRLQITETATVHTVQPGETLWDIARHYHPDADPRSVISYMRWINPRLDGPKGPIIQAGQMVLVPEVF